MKGTLARVGWNELLGYGLRELFNCQLRHMLIFIFFNQDADDVHERRKRMRLVLTNLVNQTIQQYDKLPVLFFRMRYKNRTSQRRPRICCFIHVD